ncbi:hypothetical protein NQ317_012491 [Molorchus minor]|uniref:BTB domain-containing protein n=1 Tax=Molorchus minor TaxID=1323400 RepID=A0ABQ9K488_9CUCU|nr:hypothetical protein NQ317_012491 [Molorchus minor]
MEFPKGDHYNLRWTNYTNNLIQVFSEHRHHENLVDVTFACEGEFIKAHKLILSACSDFFEGMFKTHSSVPHPIIFLNGIKFKHLKCIMEFIYHGEVKVQDEDLEEVIVLGKNLKIKVSVQSKNVTAKQPPIPNAELPMTNPPVSASDLPPHNFPPSPQNMSLPAPISPLSTPHLLCQIQAPTQTSTDLEENINDTVSKSVKSKEFENLRTSDIFSSSLGGESTKFAPNRPETENGKSVAEPVAKKRKSPEASTNSSKSRILPSLQDLEHTPSHRVLL